MHSCGARSIESSKLGSGANAPIGMAKSRRENGRQVAELILARFGAKLAYQPDADFYRPARIPDPRAIPARAGRMARLELMGQMRLDEVVQR